MKENVLLGQLMSSLTRKVLTYTNEDKQTHQIDLVFV